MNHRAINIFAFAIVLLGARASFARDSKLLNEVVDHSNAERASVEHDYRVDSSLSRKESSDEVRSMHVEIGDELGAEDSAGAPVPKHLNADTTYREKGESKNLDREWKEVNRGMRETSMKEHTSPAHTSSHTASRASGNSGSGSGSGQARTRRAGHGGSEGSLD